MDNEAKASEAKKALLQLEAEGGVSIHGYALISKHPDGSTTVDHGQGQRPFFRFTASAQSEGESSGSSTNEDSTIVDSPQSGKIWNESRISDALIGDVQKLMSANHVALVADIEEDSVIPVDTRMELQGGSIFRWALEEQV